MSDLPAIPPGTNVVGVGIDQIEVARIRDSLDKHGDHFLNKIFSPTEQAYCREKADPAPHLAARFAAKEAVSKAFGTGIGAEIGWLSVSVSRKDSGAPVVKLDGRAAAQLKVIGGEQVLLSLSHLKEMAVAFAVITR